MTGNEPGLGPDHEKLFTLARSARARVEAPAGAAVMDETGRTYNGATVALPHLSLSALQVAIALAASAGARSIGAAVVVGDTQALAPSDGVVFDDIAAAGADLVHCAPDRSVLQRRTAA